jgi:hypothetical protein
VRYGGAYEGFFLGRLQVVKAGCREGYAPAASLALWAMSSSSRSCAFFLGFLLWMGLVPAIILCQPSLSYIIYNPASVGASIIALTSLS